MAKYIDLFAGIGGIRIPFDELGHECVFSSEIDKYATETYIANYGDVPYGDINLIKEKDIPNHELLLAGFPCQPFSIAGKRKGFEDDRGNLFFKIIKIMKYHKPKVALLENVKGLLNHDRGDTYRTIEAELNKIGYNVFSCILNSKEFGVPQNRERLYIVCVRDKRRKFEFPLSLYLKTRVGNILEDNVSDKYTISDTLWNGHKRRKEEHKKKGNGFGYSLFYDYSEYTSTISARYYKDGSEVLIYQDGKNPRKITPREGLRLQGFPEDFKIVVSDTQMYKQIGNSVSVPVIRELAKRINNYL
ncbi:MAG: DNA cytosine methyltransferase [Bacilli bacterium]